MKEKMKKLFGTPLGYTAIDKAIVDFCEKNINYIFVIVITAIGLVIRIKMFPFFHADLIEYYYVWFDQLKADGGLMGLKQYAGDYNFPYPTLLALLTYLPVDKSISIKSVSVLFDICLASLAGMIAEITYAKGKKRDGLKFVLAYSFVFLSPLVMLNSSYWGQNDSIYCSLVLCSIYLLMKEKHFWSMFVYGVALAFKLQALLIFPLFVFIYLLNKKYSIFHFFAIGIGFVVTSLPGIIFSGKGIAECIRIYRGEIGEEKMLTLNFPNIYYWFSADHFDLYKVLGICFTLFIFVITCYYLYKKARKLDYDGIISLGMWCVLTCVYFLPKMHERYGMMAEILCIIWVLGNKKWLWYAVVMNTITLFSYFSVLYGYYLFYFQNMAVINIITYVIFSVYILLRKENDLAISANAK